MHDKVIDLTHTLTPSVPTWTSCRGFQADIKLDYKDCRSAVKFRVQQLKMHAGIGTHMDAPSHAIEGGLNIADLPINNFRAEGVLINVASMKIDEHFYLLKEHIVNNEKEFGPIARQSIVIVHTGWSKHWLNPEKYVNHFQFPSVSKEAAEYLLEKDILALGVDTMSPDLPKDGHLVHDLFFKQSKYIIENIAAADKLPPRGFEIIALPLKLEACTESPIRLMAYINSNIYSV